MPLRGRLLDRARARYLERAFDAAKYGQISPAPWLEIAMPTMNDPSLAPEGQHVLSIYAQFAPRRLRGDATHSRDVLTRAIFDVLEPHAPGIRRLVIGQQLLTPEDLESQLGVPGGHIFHGEPTIDQSWIGRPVLGWARYRDADCRPLPRERRHAPGRRSDRRARPARGEDCVGGAHQAPKMNTQLQLAPALEQ